MEESAPRQAAGPLGGTKVIFFMSTGRGKCALCYAGGVIRGFSLVGNKGL